MFVDRTLLLGIAQQGVFDLSGDGSLTTADLDVWVQDIAGTFAGAIKAKKDENKKCHLFPDTPATLAELEALVADYQSKVGCGKGHQDD